MARHKAEKTSTDRIIEAGEITPRPPEELRQFRKPATTNDRAWWYISDEIWNTALAKAQSNEAVIRKSGRQVLIRGNHAGRIMETDEGIPAISECHWCSRPGYKQDCRIYADGRSPACGYCLGKGKHGCKAGLAVEPESESKPGDDVVLVNLKVKMESLERKQEELQMALQRNQERLAALTTAMSTHGGGIFGGVNVPQSRFLLGGDVR